MVENFGGYLKQERELRGVPLQEIADNTKIPMRFLQALEENSLDELPGEVFIKGYIRSYAKSIGTNPEEILTAFNQFANQAREERKLQLLEREKDKLESNRQKNRKTGLWVLAAIMIILAAGYLARLYTESQKPVSRGSIKKSASFKPKTSPRKKPVDDTLHSVKAKKKEPLPLPTETQATPVPAAETEPKTDSQNSSTQGTETVDPTTSAPAIPAADTPPEEAKPNESENDVELARKDDIIPAAQKTSSTNAIPLELTIQVTEQSWFELLIDGTRVEDFILPSGTGKTFRGNTSFKITIGNRKGTRLLLNGKSLVLPDSSPIEKDVVRNFLIQAELLE